MKRVKVPPEVAKLIGTAVANQVIIEDDLFEEDFLLNRKDISCTTFLISKGGIQINIFLII